MNTEHTDAAPKKEAKLPVWLLVTVLVTLAIGVVVGLLLRDTLSSHGVAVSGPGLISFVFTVALGAASIILAIIAIFLSSQAEAALARRSDEGIRLQNDAFVRTSEVLSKIQASTGVTEKRIEDIISGRTGVIAQEVVEKSFRGRQEVGAQIMEQLKEDLATSLKSELLPLFETGPTSTRVRLEGLERKQVIKQQITEEWRLFRSAVVDALQKAPGIKLVSQTEGKLSPDKPEEFWDAVFDVNGKRVASDVHTARQYIDAEGSLHDGFLTPEGRRRYSRLIIAQAIEDELAGVALVFDKDVSEDVTISKLMAEFKKSQSYFRVVLIAGSPDQISLKVQREEWGKRGTQPSEAAQGSSESVTSRGS